MKRFTETEKWSDPWFQGLSHGSKLLFIYICDRCNNAGFYEENPREACFHLGITDDQYKKAMEGLSRGIKGAFGWIWVKNFLKHQKNLPLNEENPAHKQIIFLLVQQEERFKEDLEFTKFIGATKGLPSPIGIGKGNSKVKVLSEEVEKIYQAYPRKEGRGQAIEKIKKAIKDGAEPIMLLETVKKFAECVRDKDVALIPHPATWFHQKRWEDDQSAWTAHRSLSSNGKAHANSEQDHKNGF